MHIDYLIDGVYATWKYGHLKIIAVQGWREKSLRDLPRKLGSTRFSPVQNEIGRESIIGLHTKPVVDIRIEREFSGKCAVVARSVEASLGVVEELVENTEVIPQVPTKQFLLNNAAEIRIWDINLYMMCQAMAKELNMSLEDSFRVSKYANFHVYNGRGVFDAFEAAHQTF